MTRSGLGLLGFATASLLCACSSSGQTHGSPADGGSVDSSTPTDAPTDHVLPPDLDAMPPSGSFCALPGSIVFTAQGPQVVPGGKSVPSLDWVRAPTGFCVHYFATVPTTRQLRFAPDGHLFAASPSQPTTGGAGNGINAITVLPDDDKDGVADSVVTFLGQLVSTQGLLFAGGYLYFQDGVTIRRVKFQPGDMSPSGPVEAVTTVTLPQAPEHWPKMLDVAKDGTLYITNGSTQSEVCTSTRPAFGTILKLDTDGGTSVVAKGFRNPIALRCESDHDVCLAAELALDYSGPQGGREKIVPVHQGDDWGFPCCATKAVPYANVKTQDTNAVPDCSAVQMEAASFVIGHTPFGLAFETGKWPAPWTHRAFVTLHGDFGTWVGARVVGLALDPTTGLPLPATELDGGQGASSNMLDFATGWDDGHQDHGRPAAVEFAPDGRMFVGDDQRGAIFWVAPIDLKP